VSLREVCCIFLTFKSTILVPGLSVAGMRRSPGKDTHAGHLPRSAARGRPLRARLQSASSWTFAIPAVGHAWSFYAGGRAVWWVFAIVGAVSISRRLRLSHFPVVLPHPRLPHAALGRDLFLGKSK
jgi:hypothetical protein